MSISLVTPSYRGDIERCRILCESIDRHVTGFDHHHIIVNDEDVDLFRQLAKPHRSIAPVKHYLPSWLRPLPLGLRFRGRKIWLSLRSKPVHGWHVQQLAKLAAAARGPSDISINLDSDTVITRDFDVTAWAGKSRLPLLRTRGGITAELKWHPCWLATTTRLLGLPSVSLPADDYVGNIIAWRQDTVKAMLARIEHNTGLPWALALCRNRSFSEYLLYGYHVASDPEAARHHTWMEQSLCASHWEATPLDADGLLRLLGTMQPSQVGIAIQSFSRTPDQLIRATIGLAA